jgi:hypothetical protein
MYLRGDKMVLHIERDIETQFRDFVYSNGYVRGNLKEAATNALKEYIAAGTNRQDHAGHNEAENTEALHNE